MIRPCVRGDKSRAFAIFFVPSQITSVVTVCNVKSKKSLDLRCKLETCVTQCMIRPCVRGDKSRAFAIFFVPSQITSVVTVCNVKSKKSLDLRCKLELFCEAIYPCYALSELTIFTDDQCHNYKMKNKMSVPMLFIAFLLLLIDWVLDCMRRQPLF